jgi:hypothetical protein
MNPAPSLYSDKSKVYNVYLLESQNRLKLRIENSLNEIKASNKGEGAG